MYRFAFLALMSTAVFGLNNESWVSANGNDFNSCTFAAPCATWFVAYSSTNEGGVIHALGNGDFGSGLTITKSITIDGSGPGTVMTGGNPVLSIAVTGKTVIVRNLTLHVNCNCQGIAAQIFTLGSGIFSTPSTLNLENITVTAPSFGDNQDVIQIGADPFNRVVLKNVTTYGGSNGIDLILNSGASPYNAVLDRVSAFGALNKGLIIGTGMGVVRNSNFSQNGTGIDIFSNFAGPSTLIEHSEVSQNGVGIFVETSGVARYTDTTVTGNTTGIGVATGGQLITFRTNALAGNSADGSTPLSTSLK